MSACVGFSTCRIQFIPNDQQYAEHNYSDRSLIELRQHDFANFTLRALDIDNKKEEIFNIPLEKEDQYQRGRSGTHPDEIRTTAGTYRLWLNAASRTKFHEVLNASIEEIKLLAPGTPPTTPPDVKRKSNPLHDYQQPKPNPRNNYEEPKTNPRNNYEQPKPNPRNDYEQTKPNPRHDYEQPKTNPQNNYEQPKTNPRHDYEQPKINPRNNYEQPKPNSRHDYEQPKTNPRDDYEESNRHEILADVYQLGQHIRQGDIDDAVNLARKLSKHRVQLQGNLGKQHNEERSIPITVKIDSNDRKISSQYKNDIPMDVYPSTTIRQLRTAFEYSDNFPPSNQYFFVNGHLAYENSAMNELDVRPNSLFVLFIIQQ